MEENTETPESRIKMLAYEIGTLIPETDRSPEASSELAYDVVSYLLTALKNGVNTKESTLDGLWTLKDLQEAIDTKIRRQVPVARTEGGASWDEIGRTLGISRQAAQQRYGK